MKYKCWIMSSVITIEADNIDEAICVSLIYFQSQAPVAVYDTEEKNKIKFPYKSDEVDKILWAMPPEKLKKIYKSILKIE